MSTDKQATVLLVEDDAPQRKTLRGFLLKRGYQVLEAVDGEDAVRISRNYHHDIHLLVSDMVMPNMNGRDLAKQMHEMYPEMKTLYMSGYTANVIAHHGVLDEGINFIQKPFARGDLSIRIREVLDSNS